MKTNYLFIVIVILPALLLSSCNPTLKVGTLQTESKSVEVGDSKPVNVEINMGAGNLQLAGGTEKLLEASFTYNVAKIKPEVKYTDGTLVVRQPETNGMPALLGITDFRNEWNLSLSDAVPLNLSVDMGAGSSELKLTGLHLTGLDVSLGAGVSTIDLSGDWARNQDVTIDAGAASLNLRLPKGVGVRVRVESGPHTIETTGLTKNGEYYTNAAYGLSDVTIQVDLDAGIGTINLAVED